MVFIYHQLSSTDHGRTMQEVHNYSSSYISYKLI